MPTASPLQGYDLILDGVGFMLAPDADQSRAIEGTYVPAELQEEAVRSRDISRLFDDFSAGAGYAERLVPYSYNAARNACTRWPRIVTPGPLLTEVALTTDGGVSGTPDATRPIKASVEWKGDLYLFGGNVVWRIDDGDSAPVHEKNLDADFAATAAAVFKEPGSTVTDIGDMYVCGSGGTLIRKEAATDTWSSHASAGTSVQPSMQFNDMVVVYQVVAGTPGWRLVAADALNTGQIWAVTADPTDPSNWANNGVVGAASGGGGVAEGGYPVRALAASNRHVYFVTDVGVFDLTDQGYSPNITPYWKQTASDENGKDALVYDGKLIALHRQGVDVVEIARGERQDTSEWAMPGAGTSAECSISGRGSAMTVEGGWLVVNFYDPLTFTSNIMYAKRKETLGLNALPGPLVWHGAEIQIPYEEVTHMVVNAASGVPRLWIATIVRSNTGGDTVGDVKLYWAPVTDGESPLKNWQNGGHMQFATDWDLTLPADDVDDATSPKVVMRFDVLADNLGITGGDLVQIGVQVANVLNADGTEDAAFNSYSASAGGSPRSTLYPLDQGREYIQAYRPVFKIVGTGNEDGPAALRALKVRVGKILELRETLKYRVSLGGGRLKSGAQDTRDPKVLKAFLVNLQRRGPVQMVNEHGETVTVKVEYGVKYIVSNDPLNDSREEEAEFIVTKITQDQAVSGGSSDEDADRYDSDLVWADTDGTASGETAVWQ